MKKLNILGSLLLGILMIACDADRDSNPVINTNSEPETFTLNDPVQSGQYIDLENNSIYLTWSQPNYGYNALATYKIQVGLVDETTKEIKWNEKDGLPEFVTITYNTCKAEVSGKYIAMEINEIDGVKTIEGYADKGYREIAIRIHSSINITSTEEIKGTGTFSTPVTFKHMRSYAVIKEPASMYLIGEWGDSESKWLEPSTTNEAKLKKWALKETEIGSNIFQGTFEFEAYNLKFRFYSALTGWDNGDSWGSSAGDDDSLEIAFDEEGIFPNGEYSDGKIKNGKGNWFIKNFTGGKISFTIDMNTNNVRFVKVKE